MAEADSRGAGPTEFYRARSLDVARFYYWRRVLAQEDQASQAPGQFVLSNRAVSLPDGEEGAALEVVTADGWRLHVRHGVDKETLHLVIKELRSNS